MMRKENKKEIKAIQHERIEKDMGEGYKIRKEKSQSIAKEFEILDLEGFGEE